MIGARGVPTIMCFFSHNGRQTPLWCYFVCMATDTTRTATATPAKLRDGSWGARVKGTVRPGTTIQIRARSGKTWSAIVDRVLWSGDGVSLCSTSSSGQSRSPRLRGRRTGCSCGSREDQHGELIPSPRNCKSCEFDAWDM